MGRGLLVTVRRHGTGPSQLAGVRGAGCNGTDSGVLLRRSGSGQWEVPAEFSAGSDYRSGRLGGYVMMCIALKQFCHDRIELGIERVHRRVHMTIRAGTPERCIPFRTMISLA